MKSLKGYKKLLREYKEEQKEATFNVECAEHDFYKMPNKETWEALEDARKKYGEISDGIENVEDIINNYDFYKWCWQEEEAQAYARELEYA